MYLITLTWKKFMKYCCKLVVGTIYTPYMYLKELRSNKPLKKGRRRKKEIVVQVGSKKVTMSQV
jgi:hypothetical protein